MRFFADELLTVNTDAVSLTPAKLDNVGGARATRAIIQVRGAGIIYAFMREPDATHSLQCGPGGQIEISDYDNLATVQFRCLTGGPATLYVTYGN